MQALGLVWGDINASDAGFQEVFTVMREPSHYDARHLFEFWRDRNDEGGFVIGQHVPSRALARVMSHLVVYEPLDEAQGLPRAYRRHIVVAPLRAGYFRQQAFGIVRTQAPSRRSAMICAHCCTPVAPACSK